MSETKLLPDSRQLAGRLYGLQEAAVIAGETSIGLEIHERIKLIEANAEDTSALTPKQAAAEEMYEALEKAAWALNDITDFLRARGYDTTLVKSALMPVRAALAKAGKP